MYGYRSTHQQISKNIDRKCAYKSARVQLINIRTNLYNDRYIHTYKFVRVQIPTNCTNTDHKHTSKFVWKHIINIYAGSYGFGAVLCAYTQMHTHINTNIQYQLMGTSEATLKTDRK